MAALHGFLWESDYANRSCLPLGAATALAPTCPTWGARWHAVARVRPGWSASAASAASSGSRRAAGQAVATAGSPGRKPAAQSAATRRGGHLQPQAPLVARLCGPVTLSALGSTAPSWTSLGRASARAASAAPCAAARSGSTAAVARFHWAALGRTYRNPACLPVRTRPSVGPPALGGKTRAIDDAPPRALDLDLIAGDACHIYILQL